MLFLASVILCAWRKPHWLYFVPAVYAAIAWGDVFATILPPHHSFQKADDWYQAAMYAEISGSIALLAILLSPKKDRAQPRVPSLTAMAAILIIATIAIFDMVGASYLNFSPKTDFRNWDDDLPAR